MKRKRKLPLYEVKLSDPKNSVSFISVVKNPAIDVNWMAFSKTQKLDFATVSEEKRMLAGPFMIPDIKIYREDDEGPYEVYFSKDTIELASKKFFKSLNNLNVNEEHTDKRVPGYIVESWIITDSEKDKSSTLGFSLPVGTWFGIIHVEDETYWTEMIKTNKVKGFSVEGLMTQIKKQNMKKFEKVVTVDEVTFYTKGDTPFAVGAEVFTEVDGEEVAVADGTYTLEDESTLVVTDGIIVELTAKVEVVEEEMEEIVEPVIEDTTVDAIEELKARFEAIEATLVDIATRVDALEAAKVEVEEIKEELSAVKKFNSNLPGTKKIVKKVELSTEKDNKFTKSDGFKAFEAIHAYKS